MTARSKRDHLHLRIDRTSKVQIVAAATVVGATVSGFVRDATLGRAREVLIRDLHATSPSSPEAHPET